MAKIILAEDDDDMRRFLVKALEKAGHHVTAFGEGASAFEEIKQTTFDLLLTDIVMPEMDGIELARRAAELDPSSEDHVHHRLCGGGAASRFQGAEGCQGAVQAIPPARPRGRGRPDDGGLTAACQRPRLPAISRATQWAVSSAVEHYLDMVGATGSIPVPPTIFLQ